MRYIKVLLAIVFFYFVMLFFVQNQESLSQTMQLKLDLMFVPPMQSMPLSFYMLSLICFLLGGVCTLIMLLWDRLSISANLGSSRRRVKTVEKELAKSSEALETLKKELEQTVARAETAEARAVQAEQAAERARAGAQGGPSLLGDSFRE
jgi:hypothetical protein